MFKIKNYVNNTVSFRKIKFTNKVLVAVFLYKKKRATNFLSPYRPTTTSYQSETEREIKCKFHQFVLRMVEMYDRDIVFMYFDETKQEKGDKENRYEIKYARDRESFIKFH